MNCLHIVLAEIIKEHQKSHVGAGFYCSLFIWPLVSYLNAYYIFKPFNLSFAAWKDFGSGESIMLFLFIGFTGYMCFWALVQSAWQMGIERENGTLETIFLSPANRLAIIYGRSLGALVENIWMFLAFCVCSLVWFEKGEVNFANLPAGFCVLTLAAVVWGGLMNTIFLFSRDTGIIFSLFDEPMVLFSGVQVPPTAFPLWAKAISVIFPLTHSLAIVRNLLLGGEIATVILDGGALLFNLGIMIFLTWWLLKKAEKHAKNTGNFSFY